MTRRGWTQMDVPSGWIQVLRGPRPKSEKWPAAPGPQSGGAPMGRWRPPSGPKKPSVEQKRRIPDPDTVRDASITTGGQFGERSSGSGGFRWPGGSVSSSSPHEGTTCGARHSIERTVVSNRSFYCKIPKTTCGIGTRAGRRTGVVGEGIAAPGAI